MIAARSREERGVAMKRAVARLLAVGLLAGLLMVPSLALANVLPAAPADGQKVALNAWNLNVYEYPAGSGVWYADGNAGNTPHLFYSTGANVVEPHTSVQYLNAADVVVGFDTFDMPANVMPANWQPTGSYPRGYFRTFHHLLSLPPGADPLKTRVAIEVPPTDPEYPKYHYGIAARTAAFAEIHYAVGTIDETTLGGGRVQFILTVTNDTNAIVGPIRVQGNEAFGLATNNAYYLNAYSVVANEPAKAAHLAPGESTTFTLRGLKATPAGQLRFSNWNLWVEAESPRVLGTATFGGAPVPGVSVAVPGHPIVLTATDGTYVVPEMDPGTYLVMYSKPGYMSFGASVTVVDGTDKVQDFAMSTYPSLTRSPSKSAKTYKRKHGKVRYTLSATVNGIGSVPVGGVQVYLQKSANGKTKWKDYGAVMTSDAAGRVARSFTSKKRSTRYYRWSVPTQLGVLATPHTSKQKVVVK
jgi:hypothetical protein